jgi:hypothetical protein
MNIRIRHKTRLNNSNFDVNKGKNSNINNEELITRMIAINKIDICGFIIFSNNNL